MNLNYIPSARNRFGQFFLGVVVFLLCVNTAIIVVYRYQLNTGWWVSHTHSTLFTSIQIQSQRQRVRQNVWVYVFGAQEDSNYFLEAYQNSKIDLRESIESLKRSTVDNKLQQQRIDELEKAISARLQTYDEVVKLFKRNPQLARRFLIEKRTQDRGELIDDILAKIRKTEDDLLTKRISENEQSLRFTEMMLWVSLVGNLGAVSGLFLILYRYNQSLEARVVIATQDLRTMLAQREQLNEELQAALDDKQSLIRDVESALAKEQELNQLKTSFVNIVSHEYRTPLTVISSSAELLSRYWDRWTVEKREKRLNMILDNVFYMLRLLEDVLTIAKIDANKFRLNPESVDLDGFLEDLLQDIREIDVGNHQTQFLVRNAQEQPCFVDKTLLHFILKNLISNAVKYSPHGSFVWIEATVATELIIFKIRDEGIGIPSSDLSKLFDSFFRASNVDLIPGTGLGLAIVKRCVDLYGGTIDVVSVEGVGTTFTLNLPINFLGN